MVERDLCPAPPRRPCGQPSAGCLVPLGWARCRYLTDGVELAGGKAAGIRPRCLIETRSEIAFHRGARRRTGRAKLPLSPSRRLLFRLGRSLALPTPAPPAEAEHEGGEEDFSGENRTEFGEVDQWPLQKKRKPALVPGLGSAGRRNRATECQSFLSAHGDYTRE